MAKAKNRKAQGAGADSKTIRIIAGVILLAIILVLSIVFGVAYTRAKGETTAPQGFYVEVNGNRYYEGGAVRLTEHSITRFKCGTEGGTTDGEEASYAVRVYSTVTAQTVFSYTVNGAKRMFMDGEDYTQYFDIAKNAGGFEIATVKDTPATILQRRHEGLTVVAPETDPTISYFTLTVTNADNSQSVSFALTFGSVTIELDPPGGIII